MKHIKDTEVSVNMYAALHNITTSAVRNRCYQGTVAWRYLFPETQEYIVIEQDSYVQRKIGRKRDIDK